MRVNLCFVSTLTDHPPLLIKRNLAKCYQVSSSRTRICPVLGRCQPNQKSVALDFHVSAGRHQPLVRLLRLDLLVSGQPRYQPATATMRDHCQRHIQVHIEADFAGKAVEVEKIHADPQGIFDAVAFHVARDQLAAAGLKIVNDLTGS